MACLAIALVFSGRPDPTWAVGDADAERLQALWAEMQPAQAPEPAHLRLGYRGVELRCEPDAVYFAYGGLLKSEIAGAVEWRLDTGRTFERSLLSTAPYGVLPPSVVEF
jgi:hypothetical protein